jgi:hypothetical protein
MSESNNNIKTSSLSKKDKKIIDGLDLSYKRLVEYKRRNGQYMVYMKDGKIVKEIPK